MQVMFGWNGRIPECLSRGDGWGTRRQLVGSFMYRQSQSGVSAVAVEPS